MERVFVYGTLKQGYRNHQLLESSVFKGPGLTAKQFTMIDVGFPIIFQNERVARVAGEVYEVGAETMKCLDGLEGEGQMYKRRKLLILTDYGCWQCWTYVGIHAHWRHCFDGSGSRLVSPNGEGKYVWGRT